MELAELLTMEPGEDRDDAAYDGGWDLGWDCCNWDDECRPAELAPGWAEFCRVRALLEASRPEVARALQRGYDDGYAANTEVYRNGMEWPRD